MDFFDENIVDDLERIYTLALEKGNLAVALKAKELLAKHINFFDLKPPQPVSLADLSDEDFGVLGEYFMGRSIGDTQRHALMNQMMTNMMVGHLLIGLYPLIINL